MMMNMKRTAFILSSVSALLPFVASAQTANLFELGDYVLDLISQIIPVMIGIITVVIFWNLAQFALKAGDDADREKYKKFMIWSVVAMFLLLSFWGLVGFVVQSFYDSTDDPLLNNPEFVDKNGNVIDTSS